MTDLHTMTAAELTSYYNQLATKSIKTGSYSKAVLIQMVTAMEADILAKAPAEDEEAAPAVEPKVLPMTAAAKRATSPVKISKATKAVSKATKKSDEKPAKAAKAKADKAPARKPTDPMPKRHTDARTLREICEELGVNQKIARAKLRRANIVALPGKRWEFDAAGAVEVIALLTPKK